MVDLFFCAPIIISAVIYINGIASLWLKVSIRRYGSRVAPKPPLHFPCFHVSVNLQYKL